MTRVTTGDALTRDGQGQALPLRFLMYAQPKLFHAPAAAQRQRVFLRAIVGSIVLCAALSGPPVQAQEALRQGTERTELRSISFDPRPFRELLAKVAYLHANGLLNFNDAFEITVEADRDADGTLQDIDIASAATGADRWRELAQDFIGAAGNSGALAVLGDARHLSMTLKLTGASVFASAAFEVESAQRAGALATSYNHLFKAARLNKPGRDEGIVMSNMTASANGKQLVMKLEMSREQAGNLLHQHLSLP